MREILFRGKNKYIGWVYGDLRNYEKSGAKAIFDHKRLMRIEVDPDTIGQFTGKVDINGKQIFEGDVVTAKIGQLTRCGCVIYDGSAARYGLQMAASGERNFSFLGQPMVAMYSVTIVGNIHDHPELLEG